MRRQLRASATATPWFSLLLVAVVAAGLWWYGGDYYLTPLQERPHHPRHPILASTGSLGHPLGWLGIGMMVLLLAYSLRKRVRWLQPLGPLRHWLSVHVFLGLMGPLLVTFHTGFRVGGLVSIAYWSMILTMLSGIFGRYIYGQIPSTVLGTRQSLAALAEASRQLAAELRAQLGPAADALLDAQAVWDRTRHGWGALAGLFLDDLRRPLHRWHLGRRLRAELSGPLDRREIAQVTDRLLHHQLLERRVAAGQAMERIFHYWHVLHRPFVYITFLIAAVHIGVAWWLGYTGW